MSNLGTSGDIVSLEKQFRPFREVEQSVRDRIFSGDAGRQDPLPNQKKSPQDPIGPHRTPIPLELTLDHVTVPVTAGERAPG